MVTLAPGAPTWRPGPLGAPVRSVCRLSRPGPSPCGKGRPRGHPGGRLVALGGLPNIKGSGRIGIPGPSPARTGKGRPAFVAVSGNRAGPNPGPGLEVQPGPGPFGPSSALRVLRPPPPDRPRPLLGGSSGGGPGNGSGPPPERSRQMGKARPLGLMRGPSRPPSARRCPVLGWGGSGRLCVLLWGPREGGGPFPLLVSPALAFTGPHSPRARQPSRAGCPLGPVGPDMGSCWGAKGRPPKSGGAQAPGPEPRPVLRPGRGSIHGPGPGAFGVWWPGKGKVKGSNPCAARLLFFRNFFDVPPTPTLKGVLFLQKTDDFLHALERLPAPDGVPLSPRARSALRSLPYPERVRVTSLLRRLNEDGEDLDHLERLLVCLDYGRRKRALNAASDHARRTLVGARVPRPFADSCRVCADARGQSLYAWVVDALKAHVRATRPFGKGVSLDG